MEDCECKSFCIRYRRLSQMSASLTTLILFQHHSSMMPEPLLAATSGAPPTPAGTVLPDDDVRGLFQLWNDALATLDPDTVAKRYAKQPVLLPTVSDIPRTDYDGIKDYFVGFLQKKPQGTILESYVTSGPDW